MKKSKILASYLTEEITIYFVIFIMVAGFIFFNELITNHKENTIKKCGINNGHWNYKTEECEEIVEVNYSYGKDASNNIYFWNNLEKKYIKLDSNSAIKVFHANDSFAEINGKIYFKAKILPEVDPNTFEIIKDTNIYSRDKNNCYEGSEIVDMNICEK